MGLLVLLIVYLLGGLTFIPLVLWVVYVVGTRQADGEGDNAGRRTGKDEGAKVEGDGLGDGKKSHVDTDWGVEGLDDERMESLAGLKRRAHIPDVAAGYFAVCREYVPGGINGKPPERTTPAGSVIATESPSVYQSMYRSIFDRNKSFTPTMEGANGKSKKARNVFYVVLRLGHLMLYDDSEQLEVRHVISLTHYDISIYAGGEPIPEGELWIKRNCIRLTQRPQSTYVHHDSKPYYIFSENCSDKEDFYHAMLQSIERGSDDQKSPPRPLKFETADLVRLVQQLHASEENLHTRWINALIGRVFLAMYKTSEVEKFLWTKITKKIARVPKPALISSIKVQRIDMGNLPPFITNPKLKELTVDGDLTVEADVSYKGNLCLEISAIARIELGSRFKAREVTLVLASILKSLEGHILVRIKPPPSNRIWMTFESAPKMEFSLEPIVSSRQITYGVILRAIESRIREVVSETLVLPNWDDMPFSDTLLKHFRGGVWAEDPKDATTGYPQQDDLDIGADKGSESEETESQVSSVAAGDTIRSVSTPATLISRRPTSSTINTLDSESTGVSSATDVKPPSKPKAMRSGSFASVASPIVNLNSANASVSNEERKKSSDAASAMKTISKSQPTSPAESPVGSPAQTNTTSHHDARRSTSPASFANRIQEHDFDPSPIAGSATAPNLSLNGAGLPDSATGGPHLKSKHGSSMSLPRNTFGTSSTDKRQTFNQSINSATAVAKKWLAARQNPDGSTSPMSGGLFSRPQASPVTKTSDDDIRDFLNGTPPQSSTPAATVEPPLGSPARPIGAGHPLPPPGTPLPPPPKKNTWSVPKAATFANLARRKPVHAVPPPQLPPRHIDDSESLFEPSSSPSSTQTKLTGRDRTSSVEDEVQSRRKPSSSSLHSEKAPPLPKRRQRMASVTDAAIKSEQTLESVLVVEAPSQEGSAPGSPTYAKEHGGAGDERRRHSAHSGSSLKEGDGEDEEEVFQGMDMDDGVT